MASLVFFQDFKEQLGKGTARRFTTDDAETLMRCLRIPNQTRSREECISTVERRIRNR